MIRVALLGRQYPEQLRTNREELSEVEIAWVGTSVDQFQREVLPRRVEALVLDLADLPAISGAEVRDLVDRAGAELALVTYGYSTRSFLRELRSERIRVLQAPLSLATMRAHLAFLIVQDLLRGQGSGLARAEGCGYADGAQRARAELLALQERERRCALSLPQDPVHAELERLTRVAAETLGEVVARAQRLPGGSTPSPASN